MTQGRPLLSEIMESYCACLLRTQHFAECFPSPWPVIGLQHPKTAQYCARTHTHRNTVISMPQRLLPGWLCPRCWSRLKRPFLTRTSGRLPAREKIFCVTSEAGPMNDGYMASNVRGLQVSMQINAHFHAIVKQLSDPPARFSIWQYAPPKMSVERGTMGSEGLVFFRTKKWIVMCLWLVRSTPTKN